MLCDICGGTLVMQPGATAKCDCCGMDYSTESLRAKFSAAQTTNNLNTVSAEAGNTNNYVETASSVVQSNVAPVAETASPVVQSNVTPVVETVNEYKSSATNDKKDIPKEKKNLSETDKKLLQFFQDASMAERMLEVRKIWKGLGLQAVEELQELNKLINVKAEFERLYGFQNIDIVAMVEEWKNEYDVAIPEEIEEEQIEVPVVEPKKTFIDLICPACAEKITLFSWQVSIGEQFICSRCGESFVLNEEQIQN